MTVEDVKAQIVQEEKESGKTSFLGSIVKLVQERGEDATALEDACRRLQAHTGKLKRYVATLDSEA